MDAEDQDQVCSAASPRVSFMLAIVLVIHNASLSTLVMYSSHINIPFLKCFYAADACT